MLSVANLQAGYDETTILRDVSVKVEKGKIVAILGRNGVGKTTLMKTLMGLLKPSAGDVVWKNQSIKSLRPEQRAKKGIGYVPQGRDIFSTLTVEENLLLGLEALQEKPKKEIIPSHVFELFPVLYEMLQRKGGDLSGGQQQQLAIARALVGSPELLLLDEPMEGIQPSIVQLIERVIIKIATEQGVGIVLVEHNVDLALACSDFFYILDHGRIVAEGESKNVNLEAIQKHLVV
ncbi:urea ABC transporter ATP-binding subunit UrtE [Priestia aryabhattai]|uniref:urea ABC transporter ATP-binding subunit UrtE n=1 Tax=Bacillus sp. CBEL-1 TaxID=2502980 RepID=UPI000BA16407|nr:urea ABC transporter ATP-binding subunit UrtE [Bacillus sp. CBEL-1]OZT13848.1 urea ABC transporter ATP-binding subunit UrtE [Priestia aryabhattai]TDB49899.1 urea ABC transporter ATP-binding subunit UrtE [Bacillus sp. CBEL-1]